MEIDGINVLKMRQDSYMKLSFAGELDPNILYITYYDERTCLLCQRKYERSNSEENPNFCPECLSRLGGK